MTLFNWACTNILAAHFGYCSNEDYQEKRFQNSRTIPGTIPGTRKLHSFVPVSNTKVKVRNYSASEVVKEERVSSAKNDISPDSIVGFVTCLCDGNWWLAGSQSGRQSSEANILASTWPKHFLQVSTRRRRAHCKNGNCFKAC